MKTINRGKGKLGLLVPETPLEAVEQLYQFLEADMWYAKDKEWKTEEDMLKYLKGHFDICIKQIKRCKNENSNTKRH